VPVKARPSRCLTRRSPGAAPDYVVRLHKRIGRWRDRAIAIQELRHETHEIESMRMSGVDYDVRCPDWGKTRIASECRSAPSG
jgi:hypothetical protein